MVLQEIEILSRGKSCFSVE